MFSCIGREGCWREATSASQKTCQGEIQQEKMFHSTRTNHTPDKKKNLHSKWKNETSYSRQENILLQMNKNVIYHIPDECEKRGLNSESLSASQKRFLREFSSQKSSHINHSKKQIKLGNFLTRRIHQSPAIFNMTRRTSTEGHLSVLMQGVVVSVN